MKKHEIKELVSGYSAVPSEINLSDAGAAITKTRKSAGITQTELGNILGLGKTQISRIENSNNMTMGTLSKIYSALHYDVKLSIEPIVETKDEDDIIDDIVLCVSEYAKKHSLPIHSAFSYLKRYGAIDHFFMFNKAMKDETINEVFGALDTVARRNGGML